MRRLSYAALALTFAQIVFGAIVRITGSGMGCGDHWPKCAGAWVPPLNRTDLIVEITHRYIALALSITVVALLILVLTRRSEPGHRGLLGPSILAAGLVVTAALLGAATVKLGLNPFVIVAHLTTAMSLLAILAIAAFRAGGLGASADLTGATTRTWRAARSASAMALVLFVLGALTANLPDAAVSCGGFPWCRDVNSSGVGLWIHIAHRVMGFLLFGHLWGIAAAVAKRNEPAVVVRAARIAFGAAVLQVVIAAAMIEMHFPAALRALHVAMGSFVWLAVVVLALVSHRAARGAHTGHEMTAAA